MNAKISLFVICVEAIIYMLLYDLHDSTFKDIYFWTKFSLEIFEGADVKYHSAVAFVTSSPKMPK